MKSFGFIQGRLSPQVDGKIQAFPWDHWEAEFPQAANLGFKKIEWTLDVERATTNPFLTEEGQARILDLERLHDVKVVSLTADFFMQAPFHRLAGPEREKALKLLEAAIEACGRLSVAIIVIPLVDSGSIENESQADDLVHTFHNLIPLLRAQKVRIAFESDFSPSDLAKFIDRFPSDFFGVNYDSGNSASLGWKVREEWTAYGPRIIHLHLKDRVRGGTTVPLGEGDCDFAGLFESLNQNRYQGHWIFQTARAKDGDHAGALSRYRSFIERHYES